MEIIYRKYRDEDKSDLIKMCLGLYAEDDSGHFEMNMDKIENTISYWNKNPEQGEIIIFELDNINIGYANLIFYWSNEYGGRILHLDELYIKENFRNKGFASHFIKFYLTNIPNQVGIELQVHAANKNALKLYQNLGFEISDSTYLKQMK